MASVSRAKRGALLLCRELMPKLIRVRSKPVARTRAICAQALPPFLTDVLKKRVG
jgi:hypothetical protein